MSYSDERETLRMTVVALENDVQERKRSLGYHQDELMKEQHKLAVNERRIAALRSTMEVLELLDKAGMTMKKPVPDARKAC